MRGKISSPAEKTQRVFLLRLAFYLAVILFFTLLPTEIAESGSLCVFYRASGILCPACGVTRAMTNLCHGAVFRAFSFNPLLVCFLAPLFFFCAGQDVFTFLRRRAGKNPPPSFAEFWFGALFGKL